MKAETARKIVFSSTIFLFVFLPVFLPVYFICSKRLIKNVILLVFSLVFYAWGEPVYVWLMIGSIVVNCAMGLAMAKTGEKPVGGSLASCARDCC